MRSARRSTGAVEALDLARWDDLPDAELPWETVATLAALQGIDEADVVWDLANGGKLLPLPARPALKRAA